MSSIYEQHKPAGAGGDYLRLKDGDKVKVRFASAPAACTYDGEKIRYQWVVFNRNINKAQIYEAGAQVFGQLASLYPEWGEPTEFDVTIGRTGSGQFDTSYTVTPSPKSLDLNAEQKAMVEEALKTFPGKYAKWLADLEQDGVMPETVPIKNKKPAPTDYDPGMSEEDIPPELR